MSLAGSSGLAPNLLVLSRACVILDVLSAFALVTDQISPMAPTQKAKRPMMHNHGRWF